MDTVLAQTVTAGVIVAGAAFFLARRAWHTLGAARRGARGGAGAGCGAADGCGCAGAPSVAREAAEERGRPERSAAVADP